MCAAMLSLWGAVACDREEVCFAVTCHIGGFPRAGSRKSIEEGSVPNLPDIFPICFMVKVPEKQTVCHSWEFHPQKYIKIGKIGSIVRYFG